MDKRTAKLTDEQFSELRQLDQMSSFGIYKNDWPMPVMKQLAKRGLVSLRNGGSPDLTIVFMTDKGLEVLSYWETYLRGGE